MLQKNVKNTYFTLKTRVHLLYGGEDGVIIT